MLRLNFGGITKSIMVFFGKRPIAIGHKTYTVLRPTSMADHTAGLPSGDEYLAEPTRQAIESSTDAALDWLLADAMVAFCYCCSQNTVHFKWGKKMIINKGRQGLAFRIQFDINVYLFSNRESYWVSDENRQGSDIGFLYF